MDKIFFMTKAQMSPELIRAAEGRRPEKPVGCFSCDTLIESVDNFGLLAGRGSAFVFACRTCAQLPRDHLEALARKAHGLVSVQ
jgi:hypothetical protein